MSWQTGVLLISGLFLIVSTFVYFSARLAKRRLKRSKYGHTFDFSQMPKQKITSSSSGKKAG